MQTPAPRLTLKRFATFATTLIIFALISISIFVVHAADQTWSGGASGNNTAWFTNSNWAGGAFAGSQSTTTNTDTAAIPSTETNPAIGINMNVAGNTLYLGAINFNGANRSIGDSSTTAGTLQLNGATVNSSANVILRNFGAGTLTLQATQAGTMGIALGNATNNVININSSGGITISSIIKNGSRSKLTLGGAGSGALTLNGVNTYNGDTTINSGKLSLGTTGSIANSPNIVLAGGSTFDISTLTTPLTRTTGSMPSCASSRPACHRTRATTRQTSTSSQPTAACMAACSPFSVRRGRKIPGSPSSATA